MNFFIFLINDNQAFIPQINRVIARLGEKLHFFSPLGFEAKSDSGHKTSKLNPNSIRASVRYLNILFLVEKQYRFFDLVQGVLNQTARESLDISIVFTYRVTRGRILSHVETNYQIRSEIIHSI